MEYRCVQCHKPLSVPAQEEGHWACPSCNLSYVYGVKYLKYDYGHLLLKHFGIRFLLNRVLNANGLVSYHLLKEGSLSLPERQDVAHFKAYISSHLSRGRLLDVGCGILEVPGYLAFENKGAFDLYGIDPIEDVSFQGVRIVGCAEFTPFLDSFFDGVVFATSLDHVCSVEQTGFEVYRMLKEGGKVMIWMSDRRLSLRERIKERQERILNRLRLRLSYHLDRFNVNTSCSLRAGNFVIYPNYQVLYVPKGAVDPFHFSEESPKTIIQKMNRAKLILTDLTYRNKTEVFLCFEKRTGLKSP